MAINHINHYVYLFNSLLTVIIISCQDVQALPTNQLVSNQPQHASKNNENNYNNNNQGDLQITLTHNNVDDHTNANPWNRCDKYKCISSSGCEMNDLKQITYYVYPPLRFVDVNGTIIYSSRQMITQEYKSLLDGLLASSRSTLDPSKACLFVQSIDLSYLRGINGSILTSIYEGLPFWNFVDGMPGTNHVIINLDPTPDTALISNSIGRAIHVSTLHDTWSLRPEFDQSIPVLVDFLLRHKQEPRESYQTSENRQRSRRWQLVFVQYDSISKRQRSAIDELHEQMGARLLVLGPDCGHSSIDYDDSDNSEECDSTNADSFKDRIGKCRCPIETTSLAAPSGQAPLRRTHFKYPEVLSESHYCLILASTNLTRIGDVSNYILIESIRRGCIPIVSSDIILPFDSLLPWPRLSISLTNSEQLDRLPSIISQMSDGSRDRMSRLGQQIWSQHLSSVGKILENLFGYFDGLIYPRVLLNGRSFDVQENSQQDLDL